MKTEGLNSTGPAVALKTAYNALINLKDKHNEAKYPHARLKEKTGLTLPTLRRIRKGELGEKSHINYYIGEFVSLLDNEYQSALNEANTNKMNTILLIMREILLLEHEKINKEFD